MMELGIVNEQREIDSVRDMFENKSLRLQPNLDYGCLKIYNENNEHFSMTIIMEKQEGEEEHLIGYHCIYSYQSHRVKLQFDIQNGLWKIILVESDGEAGQNLDVIFDDVQFFTLDEQIQMIIKRLDQRFAEENPIQLLKHQSFEFISHQTPTSLTIPEDDEQQKDIVDYAFHSLISGYRPKLTSLAPPPVAPRRSRQNSACSTQSSVRYASFNPPPTAPVRRRRVIESILLHVQRKKKILEKIVDTLRGVKRPTMHDLGLDFLRVYDGRFNYRVGHTFVMSFRKKTWFLTIDQIKYVDCPVGEIGPRSVLLLHYKGQCTSVHV